MEFFNTVFEKTGLTETNKAQILIVGDSLTSDIKGGNNIGIDTCWYNPKGVNKPDDIIVNYEIKELSDLKIYLV